MKYKLKDIAKITMGQSPDSSSYNKNGKGLPFFQGNADFGELYPNERVWCNDPKKIAEPGDILISLRAPIGALNYAKKTCCIGRGLAAITIDDEAERNYVFHLLKARKNDLNNKGSGSTFKSIGKNVLEEVPVPQLLRNEQQKFMDIMDLLESVIRKRKFQIDSLDNIIRARFVEMFGEGMKDDDRFPLLPIAEIGKVISGATPKIEINEYWGGENLWITPAELSGKSFIIYDSARKITKEGVRSCALNLLPTGTVILSSRAPIGKVAIAGVPMYCNQGFKNIIPNERINSIYLYELLGMETDYLNSLGRGATFKDISKQIVENIKIKVPPIELQEKFADFVRKIDKSKFALYSKPIPHSCNII